jgi:ABC-type histidine transport system ATPase subunit
MKKSPQVKPEVLVFEGPESALERMLIDEYLKHRGISSVKELCKLPEDEAKQMMINACRYASLKLAEVESTDRFQHEIHTGD